MSQDALSGPDLDGVVVDDSDLLVPDGPEADAEIARFLARVEATRLYDGKELTAEDIAGAEHLRVNSRHGIVDILRGGLPPLDYESVAREAFIAEVGGESAPIANLRSLVGFKPSPGDRATAMTLKSSKLSTANCRSTRSPGSTSRPVGLSQS